VSAQRPGAGTVADIMSSPVITAAAEETVADAASQMVDAKVGSVVVQGQRPVGIRIHVPSSRVAGGAPSRS